MGNFITYKNGINNRDRNSNYNCDNEKNINDNNDKNNNIKTYTIRWAKHAC